MANATFYGWLPPTVDTANFSDCTVAAQWLAAFVNSHYNGTDESDAPMVITYQYLTSIIPAGSDLPTFGQAAQWYGESTNSSLFEAMTDFPYLYCPVEICKELVWAGDADLSGIGVMVVYYLAAVFATMYFLLLAVDQWEPFRQMEHHHRRWNWVVGAFHETVQSFLDTGLIFSIAMLVASVYRHGSSRLHPDKSHSLYELTNATYIGIFTLFPPLLLQIITQTTRRRRIRATLWLIAIILAVALVALYFSLTTSASRLLNLLDRQSAISDMIWEFNCEPIGIHDALDDVVITACVLLVVNFIPWVYHTFVPTSARNRMRDGGVRRLGRVAQKPSRHGRTWWENVLAVAKTVDGILCGVIMWTLLAMFTAYRGAVLDRMGSDNGQVTWSFAQVFALATWVPVAIDISTIYIYGAQEAHNGKVSENFRVVEVEEKDSHMDADDLDPYQVVEQPATYSQLGQGGVAGGMHTGGYQYDSGASKEAQPMTYMQPAPYDQQINYAQSTAYDQQTSYGQQTAYDQQTTYEQPAGYTQQPATYGQPANYAQHGQGGAAPGGN